MSSEDYIPENVKKDLERLKLQLKKVTLQRDKLKDELERIKLEEGTSQSLGELTLSLQQALISAEEKIMDLNKPKVFAVSDMTIDLKAVITADGKLVLPTSSILSTERLGTIHFNLKPIPGKTFSVNPERNF